ncbi:LOW QUALITY PROTEIN: palmitoleoyl-protein carboxylesterase NOTUM [Nilaparvata lugens]|uniref:LOW QUALITY PROTEIN: palmitoleoyl-protein carboxylesterase NOTUM n=1 Tax=Nilaparvata lugens TaxID=108931 RepID=UPI00193E3589|nr:LOW QUALITY PROTEIN: palmitoleoyl-protein carboxylesterase NOTUM [Nilaparvata lugens]
MSLVQVCIVFLLGTYHIEQTGANHGKDGNNVVNLPSIPAAPTPHHTINKLLKLMESCAVKEEQQQRSLQLMSLTTNVTCNDGSPAGYYFRRSSSSKHWIIFLEGGWYCYDQRSCHLRWLRMRHLMSSHQWPHVRHVGGILSSDPEENPHWWNANHVFVPYCTSDSWSGQSHVKPDSKFSFQGALIVDQVVRDLLSMGLENGSSLLLAGSSAGGTGVMLNLEFVQRIVKARQPHISVYGVSDSGWFLDRTPFLDRTDVSHVPDVPADGVKRGYGMWRGRVPHSCKKHYPSEPWRCYFGYRLYPTLTAPLFVFQWLFDEAQMTADNVGTPVTKQQWDYIHKMGDSLRHTFRNVKSVFAPSCISHSVLTKRDWRLLQIDDVSLPQALHCWEQHTLYAMQKAVNENSTSMLSDAPLRLHRKESRKQLKSNHHNSTIPTEQRKRRRRKNRNRIRGKKRRDKKRIRERAERSPKLREPTCVHRFIERCSWPQCNHSCPKLHNPFTGEEMDFIELLKSFGLDMMSVANALGIDIHTLNNMDHEELLNLLTQQAN